MLDHHSALSAPKGTIKSLKILPDTADVCRDNRAFLQRAVRFLAGEAGVRQFLDIGTGLPTMGSVHQVAQEIALDSRVAYVDYDPVVVAHATALLAQGRDVIAVNGDLRSPEAILADEDVRQLLDFSQPVAVLLLAVLHFVTDADRPYEAVRAIVDSPRSSDDIARFFDGLELVDPGLVNVTLWRPGRPPGAGVR